MISEATTVAKIVSGLPGWFRGSRTQRANTKESDQTIAVLTGRLLEGQSMQQFHQRSKKTDSVAVPASFSSKKPGRVHRGPQQKARPKTFKGTCHRCKQRGHVKKDCPQKGTGGSGDRKDNSKPCPSTAVVAETFLTDSSPDGWILDTGATEHMSNERESFSEYEKSKPTRPVQVGSNQIIHGIGVGTVKVVSHISGGRTPVLELKDVLYVPNLCRKPFAGIPSLTVTRKPGNLPRFEDAGESIVIMDVKGTELLRAHSDGRLYRPQFEEEAATMFVAEGEELKLWHGRFDHVHRRRIVAIARRDAV